MAAGLGKVYADQLKQIVVPLGAVEVDQFVRVEFHVDNAKDAAVLVDHREGQQAVQDEEIAGIKHGRGLQKGNDFPDHDLLNPHVERREQQAADRHHSPQSPFIIDDVEVRHPA